MNIKLKRKFTTYSEPDKWKGKAGPKYRNMRQFGVGGSGSGTAHIKGEKLVGFSGRTISKMLRKAEYRPGKKK